MYEPLSAVFSTPHGKLVQFAYRADTNDWNTLTSALDEDEYGLSRLSFDGWALDIGGHLGSVGIGLAADNPGLDVVIVEPVPENAALCRENAALNEVQDRVSVVQMAACGPGVRSTRVAYAYTGSENALHHAWIGNSVVVAAADCIVDTVDGVSLSDLTARRGQPASFLKIDCEGCEYGVLSDPATAAIPRIHGEWHNVQGKTQGDILGLLGATHDVTFSGPEAGPGGFVAVAR